MGWQHLIVCVCCCSLAGGIDAGASGLRAARVGNWDTALPRYDQSYHSAVSRSPRMEMKSFAASQSKRQKWLTALNRMLEVPDNAAAQAAGCDKVTAQLDDETTRSGTVETQDGVMMDEGHQQAIEAMNQFPNDLSVQISCMDMLAALAQYNCGGVVELGRQGAVRAMTNAIQTFSDNKEMILRLANLNVLLDSKCAEAQSNLNAVATTTVVDDALNALDRFSSDADVMDSTLSYLSNACRVRGMRDHMSDRGVPERLTQMMHEFTTNQKLLTLRGRTLSLALECFMTDSSQQGRLADAGFIKEVVDVMKSAVNKEPTDPVSSKNAFVNGMKALKLFAVGSAAYREEAVGQGALDDIAAEMRMDGLAPVGPACAALKALSEGAGRGGIELVLKSQCQNDDGGDGDAAI